MKKILFTILLSILMFSCSWWNQKIEDAKKDLLQNKSNLSTETKNADDVLEKEEVKKEKIANNIKIKYLTEEKYIKLDPIDESQLKTWEIKITWETLSYVDKIEVSFINKTSDFPEDNYTLKKFKAWWDSFKYIASSRFRVLDFWENIYTFKAYSGEKVSMLELIIYLKEPDDEEIDNKNEKQKEDFEPKLIWTEDDTVFLNLPVSDDFWRPILLWEDIFTYSLIDELKIQKKNVWDLTCENLTEFLKENINSWFYWNTCRDIEKDKWISFYVIELNGENYIYEKHYVDFIHGFYWIQWLEKGEWVTSDIIKEKNDELKEQNDNFSVLEKTDLLFKKIVNN